MHVNNGTRAASGAIQKVRAIDSQVEVEIVDDAPLIGVSGSGIADAIAEVRCVGLMNKRGQVSDGGWVRQVGNTHEFVLLSAEASGTGQDIMQKDISEIQLAGAAICAGIEALLNEVGPARKM